MFEQINELMHKWLGRQIIDERLDELKDKKDRDIYKQIVQQMINVWNYRKWMNKWDGLLQGKMK